MRTSQMQWGIAALIAGCVMPAAARADVPRIIPYQGLLTDTGGAPLPGPVNLLIRLYNGSGGGAAQLFSETQNPVPLVDGVFSINIGSATGGGVADTALNATEVWLGVSVDGGAEMTPRTRLGMVPYAAKGRSAEQLVIPNSFISAASVDATGNVGIGTTNPLHRLHAVSSGVRAIFGDNTATTGTAYGVYGLSAAPTGRALYGHATATSGNNVGVFGIQGTFGSTPAQPCGVFGGSSAGFAVFGLSGSGRGVLGLASGTTGVNYGVYGESSSSSGYAGYFVGRGYFSGNLGLATTAPTHTLDVDGAARFRNTASTNLLFTGANDDAFIDFVKDTNTTPSARILFDGFTDPNTHQGSIDFHTRVSGDPQGVLRRRLSITADGRLSVLESGGTETFELRSNFGGTAGAWMIMRATDGTPGISMAARNASTGVGGLIELSNDSGVATVSISGDTGAGFGRVTTSVLRITGGSDLAEPFMVNTHQGTKARSDEGDDGTMDLGIEPVGPGMVVVIDPEHPGQLKLSREAYDRKVAGIVSGAGGIKPGLVMGQNGTIADGEHPVALTGRVFCRCDAASGAIEPGDLLTTSSILGHAMKVADHGRAQGAILGKAMTQLAEGRGLVLVLIQPQ